MSPSDNWSWRHLLRPSGTPANTIARRLFIIAGFMVLVGVILGFVTMLLGFEGAEWAFVLIFWFGLLVSVPALVAMLLTASRDKGDGEGTG